jgi:cysteine synthase A
MIYKSIIDLIGRTPVVEIDGLYVKLEYFNASGSVKDRAAKRMIEGLERSGRLRPGDTIIEPTSGNTGISLAMIGAAKGYPVILVMPETMSVERQTVMKAYGAKIILTEGKLGMKGAIETALRLVESEGYVMPGQFDNPDNVRAHEESTAREILADFEKLDYLVSGIGTGGTISGIGRVLKKERPETVIIGVEPAESPVITRNEKGSHGIQGIGAGFIPAILDLQVIDEVRTVATAEAKSEARKISEKGLFLGISSGAALKVGRDLLRENPGKTVLVIAPDGGLKYLSTGVYDEV